MLWTGIRKGVFMDNRKETLKREEGRNEEYEAKRKEELHQLRLLILKRKARIAVPWYAFGFYIGLVLVAEMLKT